MFSKFFTSYTEIKQWATKYAKSPATLKGTHKWRIPGLVCNKLKQILSVVLY